MPLCRTRCRLKAPPRGLVVDTLAATGAEWDTEAVMGTAGVADAAGGNTKDSAPMGMVIPGITRPSPRPRMWNLKYPKSKPLLYS